MEQEAVVGRIDEVLTKCREGVAHSKELPFVKLLSAFDFKMFRYEPTDTMAMRFDQKTIVSCTRLVALLLSIRNNLLAGTQITKRALYYQLLKYYKGDYRQVSQDIKTLTYTLRVRREELGVIASSRGIFCGHLLMRIDETVRQIDNTAYFHLPTEVKFEVLELYSSIVLVIEKESVFNFLAPQLRDIPDVLMVTSKGYPDYNTQAFLKSIAGKTASIYYLGDLDPYGFDIMLQYAVGDAFEQFGVPTIQWLDIEQLVIMGLVHEESLVHEYASFTKEDRGKITAVLSREYFSQDLFEEHALTCGHQPFTIDLFGKFQRWARKINRYRELQCKIELESVFKCLLVPAGGAILRLLAEQCVV